jgi:hypothetical protein
MTITLNGTTGITNDGGYTGDGVVFADTTPANTLVTTTGGNVGVGTASPSTVARASFGNSSAGGQNLWAAYFATNSDTASAAPNFGLAIGWNRSGGGGESNLVYGTGVGSTPALAFSSSDGATVTERARINSSGNLLVGTTTAQNARLVVEAKSGGYILQGTNANTVQIQVAANGNVQNSNNSYGAISDAKLKENIADATPKLAALQQVRVVNYNLIGDAHKQIGVVAQELEQIFPGMVDESPDQDAEGNDLGTTTKSVKYSVFVPMLIKAIQEQQQLITALTARVAALEGTQNV